jgi:hypothetical protein
MLILKRLAVWLIETSLEVLLLGLVLTLLLGHDQHAFLKDVLIYSSGIVLLFFTTGYLLTTTVARAVWRAGNYGRTQPLLQSFFLSTSRL